MGVKVRRGRDKREEVVVSCDHDGCKKVAVRKMEVFWYNRENGHQKVTVRNPRKPFPYWRKVFGDNRYKNTFHLQEGSWPEGVRAYCNAHDPPEETEPETEEAERTERLAEQPPLFSEPTQMTLFED